jgi:hypothetical protein
MMRIIGLFVAAALVGAILFAAAGSQAGKIPESATYLYYIKGEYVGKSSFEISQDDEIYAFESRSEIAFEDYEHAFAARTEIEKETLKLRFYKYEGRKMKEDMLGTIWVEGDSISADNTMGETHSPSGSRLAGPTFLFQDYFAEHQIVILWAVSRAEPLIYRFDILLPAEFMKLSAVSTIDSEIELATPAGGIVCKKYGVSIQNSGAFFLYLDPKRDIPVYMDFQTTQAEAFLESVYGEDPPTKYTKAAPEQ